MLGTCSDCNRETNPEQYPYFFSICAGCWERFKNAGMRRPTEVRRDVDDIRPRFQELSRDAEISRGPTERKSRASGFIPE